MKTLITVKCQMCGREFWARSITRKYCPECLQKRHDECNRHSKPKHVEKHICPVCGKKFEPKVCNQVYCSHACAIAFHSNGLSRQPCILCGRKGNTLQTQVCASCMDKLMRTWEKECSPGHRKCLVCGKEFVPNQVTYDMVSGKYHVTGQLTCSIRCTDILYGYSSETAKENTVGYKNGKVD